MIIDREPGVKTTGSAYLNFKSNYIGSTGILIDRNPTSTNEMFENSPFNNNIIQQYNVCDMTTTRFFCVL